MIAEPKGLTRVQSPSSRQRLYCSLPVLMHPSQLFYPVPEIVAPSVQTQLTGEVQKPLSRQILVFPDDDSGKEGSPVEVAPPG